MPEITANHTSFLRRHHWWTFPSLRLNRDFTVPVLVALAYYGGTKLGLLFTPPSQPISTLWPPNALVFAALLLTPVRTWPILIIAVLPAHLFVELRSGIPLTTAMGWYVTNVLEALLGAASLHVFSEQRHIPVSKLFRSFQGIILFVIFGALLAPFVTSFLDAAVVVSTGLGSDFWKLWTGRFLSNMLANLTLVPPIVVIGSERRWNRLGKRGYLEAITLALAIALIVGVVLRPGNMLNSIPALIYLLLPFLLWAAIRFGTSGASASLLLTALLSIWTATHGRGPLEPPASDVLSLQIFLSAMNVPLLCLAAVFEERREVEERLRQHQSLMSMVSHIGAKFVNISWDRIDDEIKVSLAHLRTFLGVDRVSIFEFTQDEGFRLCYTAFRAALDAGPPDFVDVVQVVRAIDEMSQGKALLINDIDDLPEDGLYRKTLAESGVRSIAVVPFGTQPTLAGSLSVALTASRREWAPDLIPQLQILGDIFYEAMQRKNAFQALNESEQRFQHAVDHSPMLVWAADPNGRWTYFSRGWLDFAGVALEKLLGDGWASLIHPEDIEPCLFTYKTAFETREQFEIEYRLRRHDGEYRWVHDVGAPRFTGKQSFIGFMGSAIDVTDRRNAQEAMSGLTRRLIKAQEEERQRIARELHDNIGQRLALLTIDLDRLHNVLDSPFQRSMLDLLNQANSISDCVRNISHTLHAASLDLLPLGAALRALCREFPSKTSIAVHFEEHKVQQNLPDEVKLCLYRVTQEALQNIAKHSRAHKAKVELNGDAAGIRLAVTDDGLGFRPGPQPAPAGLGLASMRERLKSVSGTIKITSAPMQGTVIEAYVPLENGALDNPIEAA